MAQVKQRRESLNPQQMKAQKKPLPHPLLFGFLFGFGDLVASFFAFEEYASTSFTSSYTPINGGFSIDYSLVGFLMLFLLPLMLGVKRSGSGRFAKGEVMGFFCLVAIFGFIVLIGYIFVR
jgi:hypothetical protein